MSKVGRGYRKEASKEGVRVKLGQVKAGSKMPAFILYYYYYLCDP